MAELQSPLVLSLIALAALLLLLVLAHLLRLRERTKQLDSQIIEHQQSLNAANLALRECEQQANIEQQLLSQRLALLDEQYSALQQESQTTETQLRDSLSQQAAQAEALKSAQEKAAEKQQLLDEAKRQLGSEFEHLANRIFEAKQASFQQQSSNSLDSVLKPFREQISEFRQRVDSVHQSDNKDRASLREELKHLKDLNRQISDDAINLTKALKGDSKVQGNWGEVILERVLEESGLHKGREYFVQQNFSDDSGRRYQPDVIVRLPEERDIIVDAKVSLTAYEQYCAADDEAARAQFLAQHVRSVKQHIDKLSEKNYEDIDGLRSLDFVFIFIPIEAAFMAAFESDPEAFRQAYDKQIIVVSPTTLLATLRTVQSIWRYERQNKNAELIAAEAGKLHDQFVLVLEAFEDLGKHLDKGQAAYQKTLDRFSRGRGNMVGRVKNLEALGAKVKKQLAKTVTEGADPVALPSDTGGPDHSGAEGGGPKDRGAKGSPD